MRRILSLSVLCLAAGVLNACKPEVIIDNETPPTAGIRFINAVPDTGAVDFRPVDIVENSTFYGVAHRATEQVQYKNARAGSRHFRIFMANTDLSLPAEQQQAIAATVVKDTTVTLEAGHRYTFILWGYARTGSTPAMRLEMIDDNPADPGSQVALRLVNAAAGRGPVDGRQYPATGTAPATPTWANVAALSVSAYEAAPVGSIRYNIQRAGGGGAFVGDATALAGSPATVDLEALPGTTVAGSAVSGFLFPGSVLGSRGPQTGPSVSTTGTTSLSATATGYARAAGSFVTDGFIVGDTVTASGFATAQNNGTSVVTAVAATALTVTKVGGTVAEASAAARRVITPRPSLVFFWDRRPPRPAGL